MKLLNTFLVAGAVSAQGPCEGEAIQYLNMAKSAVQSVGFDDFVANMNDITAMDMYSMAKQDFSHDLRAYKNLSQKNKRKEFVNTCKKWWPELSTKPILGAATNAEAAQVLVGMMKDGLKGFGVSDELAGKLAAFVNSVFDYLMEDDMAVVQKLAETFGGEDMSGMDVNGLLNMYRGNFLSQAEEFDGYIQKAKVATCKEKYTLAKAFRKFKNKPLANGDEFMKFVERASMNELSQIGQMGGFEMPTSDMLGDTSGQLEIAETIFPGATIGDTLSAIDAAVQATQSKYPDAGSFQTILEIVLEALNYATDIESCNTAVMLAMKAGESVSQAATADGMMSIPDVTKDPNVKNLLRNLCNDEECVDAAVALFNQGKALVYFMGEMIDNMGPKFNAAFVEMQTGQDIRKVVKQIDGHLSDAIRLVKS